MSWSSGTNTIKEGGEAKNLTLQMLEVPKQSGGTEYFVRKSDVTLGTKSISQNGTYTAASDGKYGFSQVTVNVRGGNGSADSSGKPSTSPNAPKPGGSGSAVVGTDPTTGNDQVVGVDESGNLVTTTIPSAMHVITPPTNTTYNLDDTLDFTGLVCGLKKRDGSTFTDSRYPNGHIPMQELIFPMTTAKQARIPVRWQSVYDGRLLADGFDISIGNAYFTIIQNVNGNLEFSNNGKTLTIHFSTMGGVIVNTHGGDIVVSYTGNETGQWGNCTAEARYPDLVGYGTGRGNWTIGANNTRWSYSSVYPNFYFSTYSYNRPPNYNETYVITLSEIGLAGGSSGTTESSSGTSGSGGGGSF